MKNSDFELIAKACRYNSGSHFLDSGSAYGRHHEKAPLTEAAPAVSIDVYGNSERGWDITATLETAHFLSERCSVDPDISAQFEEWAGLDENSDKNWFEASEEFCRESLGLFQHARDNVYNGENDLSQVYIWEVWSADENESDWVYAKDALCVVFIHTGCDVRGGYSKPLFLRHSGDYAAPLDFVAQFGISEGRDAEGNELDRDEFHSLDERWQCGYSSCPSSQLNKDVARVFWRGPDWFIASLKSGEIVKIFAAAPYV
jgi:hypothetical protein